MALPPMLTTQMLRPPPALWEAHFWCMFPEEVDMYLLKSYRRFLCPEELADVPTARTQKMQTGRLLARTLIRTTLARYANGHVDPSSLRFKKNGFGKPQVIWRKFNTRGELWKPPNLCFNLSHTESLIACGVTLGSAIGIDVEEKNRKLTSNLMKFAHNRLSPKEADWLQSVTDSEEQHQQFMRLWTLKVGGLCEGCWEGDKCPSIQRLHFSPAARELLRKVIQLPADPQDVLARMNDRCQEQHTASGLVDGVRSSTVSQNDAEKQVLDFVSQHVAPGRGLLSGNSVYVDLMFLRKHMPKLAEYFPHVLVDVSSLHALCVSWYPRDADKAPPKKKTHRALEDIKGSIAQLRYMQGAIFKRPQR